MIKKSQLKQYHQLRFNLAAGEFHRQYQIKVLGGGGELLNIRNEGNAILIKDGYLYNELNAAKRIFHHSTAKQVVACVVSKNMRITNSDDVKEFLGEEIIYKPHEFYSWFKYSNEPTEEKTLSLRYAINLDNQYMGDLVMVDKKVYKLSKPYDELEGLELSQWEEEPWDVQEKNEMWGLSKSIRLANEKAYINVFNTPFDQLPVNFLDDAKTFGLIEFERVKLKSTHADKLFEKINEIFYRKSFEDRNKS